MKRSLSGLRVLPDCINIGIQDKTKMQVYIICTVFLCAPAVFGMFSPSINIEYRKYRDDCIAKVGLTSTDVISQIKSRKLPDDGSADTFAICMLQTFHVLNDDGTINPDVSSYNLMTDYRNPREVAEQCVPKCGSIGGKAAVTIFKCLDNNGIVVLPFIN